MKREVLFIGQAPPLKPQSVPFGRTHLYRWLATIGIEQESALERFSFTALVLTFPGLSGKSHRPPSDEEIQRDHPALINLIEQTQPHVIVPVGVHAIRKVLANENATLQQTVGQRFKAAPFGNAAIGEKVIIPIPHPSGASTWVHQGNNKQQLERALMLLKTELAQAT